MQLFYDKIIRILKLNMKRSFKGQEERINLYTCLDRGWGHKFKIFLGRPSFMNDTKKFSILESGLAMGNFQSFRQFGL